MARDLLLSQIFLHGLVGYFHEVQQRFNRKYDCCLFADLITVVAGHDTTQVKCLNTGIVNSDHKRNISKLTTVNSKFRKCQTLLLGINDYRSGSSGVTSLNGARPLNSNGAPTKYTIFTVSKKQKKIATLFLVLLIGFLRPLELLYPIFFRVDQTLSCARYSRFFGIKTVNSGKKCPPEAAPVR